MAPMPCNDPAPCKFLLYLQLSFLTRIPSLDDEAATRQKALQNIVAGQQSENLLDFGDDDARDGQPSGLAATTISATPAATMNMLQNSTNPLDDLVSIFGSTGLGNPTSSPPQQQPQQSFMGLGALSPQPTLTPSPQPQHTQAAQAQDDLLGLF